MKFIPDNSAEVMSSGVEPTGLGHGDIANDNRLASDQRWTAIGDLPPICANNDADRSPESNNGRRGCVCFEREKDSSCKKYKAHTNGPHS